MNPRGRWRRRRNLRRVPTTSDQPDRSGARKRSISASHTVRDPVFGAIFSENRAVRSSTCSKKRLTKKNNKHLTDEIWPISSSAGTVFWTAKCQIPVAKPLKSCPQNELRISLKNPTKGHLRLLLGRWHSPQVAPAAQKNSLDRHRR